MKMKTDELKQVLNGCCDEEFFKKAAEIRDEKFGKEIYLRGVVEFSNICKEQCLYCGLRASNKNIKRYRLTEKEILDTVDTIRKHEIGTVVLQSGNDPYYDTEFIAGIIKKIKAKHGDKLAITLSLGERGYDELKRWKEAGAERYLIKVETFDEKLYEKMRPGRKLKERIIMIEWLKKLGYEVGSGIIIGLPYSNWDILSNDINRLSTLDLHMIAAGPFIPHPETPLKDFKSGDVSEALRIISILRILNFYSNIPSTSAMAAIKKESRMEGLRVGANVIMPSFTPERVRKLYYIYPGKNQVYEDVEEDIETLKKNIIDAGFIPSKSVGSYAKRSFAALRSDSA